MIIELADRLNQVEEYYFSRKLQEIARLNRGEVQIVNLGIGKPDLAPAAIIIDSLHQDSMDPSAHGYQSYIGIHVLRETMAGFYQEKFGVIIDPESEVLPLMGSKEGIMHLSMALLNKGDEVMVPNPGYPSYTSAAKLTGAKIVPYDLIEKNDYLPDFNQLDRLKSSRTKILWINYPHMPTGTKANKTFLEQLVIWAKANNILLASDSPYSFILNEERHSILSIDGAKEVCVELNSLSKSHGMSGWRVGMAMGNKHVLRGMLAFKSNMDSGMFRPIQKAAVTAMKVPETWYHANDEIYRKRRAKIWELLDKIGFSYTRDTAGLFVWSKISDRFFSGEEASDFFLYSCKVFAPPGMIFGSNGDQYVRWSLCQPITIIEEAYNRINSVMNF